MTPLEKPVTRRSNERVRDAGKSRRIVVTLYPNGLIGLRPERTRREETVPIDVIWLQAVKARVLAERAAKRRRT